MVGSNIVSKQSSTIISLDRFSYAYPGSSDWVLRDISLQIKAGHCYFLHGPTGSGKTTLMLALRGLLPTGSRQTGEIRRVSSNYAGHDQGFAGLIMQNPRTQLLNATLGSDVAFGLENNQVDPLQMPLKVEQALEQVGLKLPFSQPVDSLSMGQQYRACMAGIMVMDPFFVMFDEPMTQLDHEGREKTLALIRDLKKSGRTVLVCDHRSELLQEIVDQSWYLDEKGALYDRARVSENLSNSSGSEINKVVESSSFRDKQSQKDNILHQPRADAECIIRVKGFRFENGHHGQVIPALSFDLVRGEKIAVCGPNGSGKTTLLRSLVGLVQPFTGSIEIFGRTPRMSDLRGRVSLLFQDPQKQIFETTVFAEVAFSARRNGLSEMQISEHVNTLLERLELDHLATASPHLLSYGQKHLVGLAAVLAGKPEILLLDDPFAGLDRQRTRKIMELVTEIADANEITIIWTSHDTDSVANWADRVIDLSEMKLNHSQKKPGPISAKTLIATPPSVQKRSLGTGLMLILSLSLSMAAFAARSPVLLAGLTAMNFGLIIVSGPKPLRFMRKSVVFFFWQAVLVVLLYGFRFGLPEGIIPGLQTAWQLFLAFWPGMIFISSNSQPRIMRTLSHFLPYRIAFVVAVCLRFLPMLLTEIEEIRETQILRGARIMVVDLKNPCFWPDWFSCLAVPTLIKTLSLAGDIALAASARDFGISTKRTVWSGD